MFDHELKALESKESAFFCLLVSFIFNSNFYGRIPDQHPGVVFNKTNQVFWKVVRRNIIPSVYQSWPLLCIKRSLTDWKTKQGHLLDHIFEVCWMPLKLTDSLNQHLMQTHLKRSKSSRYVSIQWKTCTLLHQ